MQINICRQLVQCCVDFKIKPCKTTPMNKVKYKKNMIEKLKAEIAFWLSFRVSSTTTKLGVEKISQIPTHCFFVSHGRMADPRGGDVFKHSAKCLSLRRVM